LGLAALGLAAVVTAQSSQPQSSSKEAKIRELMHMTGAAKMGIQIVDQMINQFRKTETNVPASFWDDVRAGFNPEELENRAVPIYAKHFDETEIQQIIAFYKTPIGQKMLKELPGIVSECVEVGQRWGQEIVQKIIERLKQNGYKRDA
jgi:hypothetical protein